VFCHHSAESAICCFGRTVCMQLRWVYRYSWRSVLAVSGLIIPAEYYIHSWKRWWWILILGWGNPGHREL
jgi:hypothetical protein